MNLFSTGHDVDFQGNRVRKGALEAWKYKVPEDKNQRFAFEKLWARNFPRDARTIYWSQPLDTLFVGLTNGLILFMKISKLGEGLSHQITGQHKIHSSRVTGMFVDTEKKFLYSISHDRKLQVFSLEKSTIVYSKIFPDFTPPSFEFRFLFVRFANL